MACTGRAIRPFSSWIKEMNQLPRLAGDDSGSCLTEHKLLVVLIGIAIFLAAMDLGATLYHFFQEGQAHNAL